MPVPPPDQRYRNIGFLLEGGGLPSVSYDFYIRPENLVRSEPSRLTVLQTLGGAWADNFGRGLSTITMSGNTGWRGTAALSGEDLFKNLRIAVFQGWHDRRSAAIALGQDAAAVNLYFADSLDRISVIAAPQSFTLRRSRSSPLLMNFEIQLMALADASEPPDAIDAIALGMTNPLRWQDAIATMQLSCGVIANLSNDVSALYSSISGPISNFLQQSTAVFSTIMALAQEGQGVFDAAVGPVFALAQQVAQSGANVFYTLANVEGIVGSDMCAVMQLASAFTDVYCSIINGFNTAFQFLSFDGLLGASNCSSTGGGEPNSYYALNNLNPFSDILTPTSPVMSASASAQSALTILQSDPLQAVLNGVTNSTVATAGSMLSQSAAGITAPAQISAPVGSALAETLAAESGSFTAGGYTFGPVATQ